MHEGNIFDNDFISKCKYFFIVYFRDLRNKSLRSVKIAVVVVVVSRPGASGLSREAPEP